MGAFLSVGRHWSLTLVSAVIVAGAIAIGAPASTHALPGSSTTDPSISAVASPAILAPPDVVVGEADGSVDLMVRLADAGLNTVTVAYATVDSTAVAGSCNGDYFAKADTLTFAPGEKEKVVRVDLRHCVAVEPFESFTFVLSTPTNATIARASTRIGLVDQDTEVDTPALFVRDAVVDEMDGSARVSVLLGGPTGQASNSIVTVNYATADGSATAGDDADYRATAGTLTFAPGETAKTVLVPIHDDDSGEPSESFALTLSGANNASITDASGVVLIGPSDGAALSQPSIFAPPDMVVGEADGFLDLVVGLSARSPNTVTVAYETTDSTAVAGSCNGDYIDVGGKLTFAPGETTKAVRVDLRHCVAVEPFESFTFVLSTPTNATIARASTRIGLVDQDTEVDTPALFVRDAVVDEMDGSARVSVLLGGPTGQASNSIVTVNYATADGSATAGDDADYRATAGTLTFAPGETAKTVLVPIHDDDSGEPSESFALTLSGANNASITDASGVVLIGPSDGAALSQPSIFAPPDMVVGEADGFLDLVVGLSARSPNTVTVAYETTDSTAVAGSCNGDYIDVGGKLTFAPGETTKAVRVDLRHCVAVEPFESFTFVLSTPTNATIARASTRIGLVDQDTEVDTPALFVRDAVVDEMDGSARVSVLLGGPTGQASNSIVTVNYATADGSATAGDDADYRATAGTLTFAPGETAKTVLVPIHDDDSGEPSESFALTLSGANNASITDASGVVLIGPSDGAALSQPSIFAPPDMVVGEADGFLDLVVGLSARSPNTVTVEYATADGTAVAGSCNGDYIDVGGKLTFAPGETTKAVRVDLRHCVAVEPLEFFTFVLSTPTNATIARTTGRIYIVDGTTAPPLLSIAVTPANPTIAAGGNQQFTATGTYSGAIAIDLTSSVTWGSSNVVVATIGAGGLTHGVSTGTSTISASLGGISGSTLLSVTGATLTSIAVTPAAPTNAAGTTRQFTATGTFSNATTADLTGSVTWGSSNTAVATIGAGGLAHAVGQGTSTISATLGPISGSTLLTVTKNPQTITFAALANKTYGDPDFTVSATASSSLPVSISANGNCTLSAATVHITGAGSCTITASQPGNADYTPAPSVARTFAIAKASQTITFAALANKRLGDPDFSVTASASSVLAVAFAASGNCTVTAARIHLTGAGSCTITASQPGNANYNAAPAVSRTFSITTQPPPPPRCRVPRVLSMQLAAAKATITKSHCRTGKVTRVYSRAKQKGVVIGQSRRPGRVLPANSKIDLVVSRGRRRP